MREKVTLIVSVLVAVWIPCATTESAVDDKKKYRALRKKVLLAPFRFIWIQFALFLWLNFKWLIWDMYGDRIKAFSLGILIGFLVAVGIFELRIL